MDASGILVNLRKEVGQITILLNGVLHEFRCYLPRVQNISCAEHCSTLGQMPASTRRESGQPPTLATKWPHWQYLKELASLCGAALHDRCPGTGMAANHTVPDPGRYVTAGQHYLAGLTRCASAERLSSWHLQGATSLQVQREFVQHWLSRECRVARQGSATGNAMSPL